MYINRPLKEYFDDLGRKVSAPGGGSAAALTAVTGTSLMTMVANYTIGKSGYQDVEGKAVDILSQAQSFDLKLRALIDEDVDAYKKLTEGLKSAPGDQTRTDELYKDAMEPPFMVCDIAAKCLKLCMELAKSGNRNLITDTAIAAILLDAAFFAAKFNVYINLKYIKDTDYIAKIHNILGPLEIEVPKLKEEILEICEDVISM